MDSFASLFLAITVSLYLIGSIISIGIAVHVIREEYHDLTGLRIVKILITLFLLSWITVGYLLSTLVNYDLNKSSNVWPKRGA